MTIYETDPGTLYENTLIRLTKLTDREIIVWVAAHLHRKVERNAFLDAVEDMNRSTLLVVAAEKLTLCLLQELRRDMPQSHPAHVAKDLPEPDSGRYSIVPAAIAKVGAALALLFVVHVITGCASAVPPGDSYHVVVSPKFSADEATLIMTAADSWAPVAHLDVVIGTPAGQDHEIDIAPGTLADDTYGWTVRSSASDSATTTLDTARIASGNNPYDSTATKLQTVAAHELGHAMGLVHTGPQTLMYFDADLSPMVPQAADFAQWHSLR